MYVLLIFWPEKLQKVKRDRPHDQRTDLTTNRSTDHQRLTELNLKEVLAIPHSVDRSVRQCTLFILGPGFASLLLPSAVQRPTARI